MHALEALRHRLHEGVSSETSTFGKRLLLAGKQTGQRVGIA